jgi:hypothetical protein
MGTPPGGVLADTPRPFVSGHRLGWNTGFNQIGPVGRTVAFDGGELA